MSGTVDYNYLAQDPVRPLSQTISNWQQVQKNALDIQNQQAQVEQGKALQQAIDPQTGQFDQAKYNQLLATNPMAARGAAQAAQAGVNLDTDTYKLHTARLSRGADAIGTLIGRYPNGIPQDAANAAIDQEVTSGLITAADGATLKTQFGADPRQNSQVATQLYSHNMSTQQQLDRMYGTRTAVTGPGGTNLITLPPPGPNQPNVYVPSTMGPEQAGGQVHWTDTQGVEHYGTGAQYATERGLGHVVGPAVPVLTPPTGRPPTPAPPGPSTAPPPPPPGTVIKGGNTSGTGGYTGGPRSDIQTGTNVASADNSFAPATGAAAPPSGAVAGDVAAIQGGMQTARSTPSGAVPGAVAAAGPGAGPAPGAPPGAPPMTDTTGPSPGYLERIKQDQVQYAADQRNLNNRYTNVQNLNTALEALKLTNTGRSTGAVHNFYSFLVSQGIAPGFVDNDVTQYDIARKAMMAFAASRANAGGTDLARVQSELSNASPEIAQGAALHVLKQNLGLENMEIAANLQQTDKSGKGYGDSKAQFYQNNDPRAFAWHVYTPEERQAIIDEVKKTEGGYDKLKASLQRAIDLKLVPKPAQSSQAAPPASSAPAPNALAMAQPANALAA